MKDWMSKKDASGDSEDGEEDDDELLYDRWKCRRLYLTRLAKISGEFVP